MTPTVGFAGMTHLGLVSASAVASRGFDVVCFDPDRALIARLRRQSWPVLEPSLDELIRSNGGRQRFSDDINDLTACDLIYVARDVETDENGHGDVGELSGLIRSAAMAMNPAALMVILSQVPPG